MNWNDIANRIKVKRRELGLTLSELGAAIGKHKQDGKKVSHVTVRNWESGSEIKKDNFDALVKALGVSSIWLETGKETTPLAVSHTTSYESTSPVGASHAAGYEGEKLPSEEELAALISVSTNTYRGKLEEIQSLKNAGVLEQSDQAILDNIESLLNIIRERYKDRLK